MGGESHPEYPYRYFGSSRNFTAIITLSQGNKLSLERKNFMLVFVLNKHGESLMPCSNRKARLLLKEGKAEIHSYKPFSIQLKNY